MIMPAPVISIFEVEDYRQQVMDAAKLLGGGGVAVLPSETIYAAAAQINVPQGAQRLRELRGGEGKPFVIHLPDRRAARRYLGELNDRGERMIRKLWPGPVGMIFEVPQPRRAEVAAELGVAESDLYESGHITLRCPDHVVTSDIIGKAAGPVAMSLAAGLDASSACRVEPLVEQLGDKADLYIDAGPTRYCRPSTLLRVGDNGYEIVRTGVYDERIIERLLRTTVLFVCSGNTCRSPMAEAIARRILSEQLGIKPGELEQKGVSVMSAGSFAVPGARATPEAVEAVKGLGADLSQHRSRPLSIELIHQADVVFTMGRSHRAAVLGLVPSAEDKVVTLDPEGDIDDPIGGDASLYERLATQLQELIEKRLREKVTL